MVINKVDGKLRACFSPKELSLLLVSNFFSQLSERISRKSYDEEYISTCIKKLADKSVDSVDYEFFVAVLELYEQFNKNCNFCFDLKDNFNPGKDIIKTLDNLRAFRDDPPDVIVNHQNKYYEFELKRYRGELNTGSLFSFINKKVITHYSGQRNYLVMLQPKPYTKLSSNLFKRLHGKIKQTNKNPGVIGFSLNNDNKEIVLIRVFPDLEINKRKFKSETDMWAEILHSN